VDSDPLKINFFGRHYYGR